MSTTPTEPFRAVFHCSDGCDFRAELTEVVYRCPRCQGLLEVEHDLAALATRSAAEWKALFDARFRVGPWPLGSGVWGKKEWVQVGYHARTLPGVEPHLVNPSVPVEATLGAVRDAVARRFGSRG